MESILDITRLGVGAALLCYASWTDWKYRIVRDHVWKIMGAAGMVLLEMQILAESHPAHFQLIMVTTAVLCVYPFVEPAKKTSLREGELAGPLYRGMLLAGAGAASVFVYLAFAGDDGHMEDSARILTIPIFMAAAYGLYYMRLLFGGADSKAVAFISLMMPFYPSLGNLPVFRPGEELGELALPFPLVILMNALVLFLAAPLVFAVHNLRKGEFEPPHGFFGYKMDVNEVPGSFVWLMEKVKAPREEREIENPPTGETPDGNEEKEDGDRMEAAREGQEAAADAGSPAPPENRKEQEEGHEIAIDVFPKHSENTEPYMRLFERHFEFVSGNLAALYDTLGRGSQEAVRRTLQEKFEAHPKGERLTDEEAAHLQELLSCNDRAFFREMMEKEDFAMLKRAVQKVMLERLRAAGRQRVWVSPKIPFIIPLALSYVLSFFVGSVIFSILFSSI